jgi:cell division protein FtsZ
VHPEANIIFGAVIDDTLGDEVRVTVIAAGFDGGEPSVKVAAVEGRRSNFVPAAAPAPAAVQPVAVPSSAARESVPAWSTSEAPTIPARSTIAPAFEDRDDDLDIPDFLK